MDQNRYSSWKWRSAGRANRLRNWGTLSLAAVALLGCGATTRGKGDGNGNGGGPGIGHGGTPNAGGTITDGPGIRLQGDPKYYRFVRLTNSQWAASVQEVLKLTEPSGLEAGFSSPVVGTTEFSNNELLLDVNSREWSAFQAAAETLAEQVTASDETLAVVYPDTDVTGFIQTVGRRAFRRPLTALEVDEYTVLFNQGKAMLGAKSEFAKGAALVIRA
ncbi:MAG TPA: DUF1595 domain-containing protein, partial [Polyangiaceae bacterium]|nr:DUF1595 domain-containing protein [Polyangiaceae bacterium]